MRALLIACALSALASGAAAADAAGAPPRIPKAK